MMDYDASIIIDDFLLTYQQIFTLDFFYKAMKANGLKITKDYARSILESSDMEIIYNLLNGEDVGTIFLSDTSSEFDIIDFIKNKKYLEK